MPLISMSHLTFCLLVDNCVSAIVLFSLNMNISNTDIYSFCTMNLSLKGFLSCLVNCSGSSTGRDPPPNMLRSGPVPIPLLYFIISWQRYRVGLRRKHVTFDDGFKMYYAERGQRQEGLPTMVMLHGFSGSLDAAVPVVKVNS